MLLVTELLEGNLLNHLKCKVVAKNALAAIDGHTLFRYHQVATEMVFA